VTLGVIHPSGGALDAARQAVQSKLNGVVLEGDFDQAAVQRLRKVLADSKVVTVELPPRAHLRFDTSDPVVGTYQGVWPGVNAAENGTAKAAPSGAPWIDTNTGFLRFVRAVSPAAVWIANTPPPKTVVSMERYLQVIGDAAMVGARWVIALDDDLSARLMRREDKALQAWQRLAQELRFYEQHAEWRTWRPYGQLAIVQDVESGALLSGGILDMIAVKHTPVRPVPNRRISEPAMEGAKMAVTVDPSLLNNEQKDVLRSFARRGGTVLSGPPGWKFPMPKEGQITLGEQDTAKLDEIWKEVNGMTGRKNLGARLFNVSSMLSNLITSPDGKQIVLHLVNYSDYPVESVTVHVLGKHTKVTLLTPEAAPKASTPYDNDEGTGIDIDKINTVGALVIE
jgi:hypothetical protein